MDYIEFKIGDTSYDLKLTTRNLVKLERALGSNPLSIFMGIENNELPTLTQVSFVLYYALQAKYSADFTNMDKVYDLYDEYIDNGGSLTELIPVLVELYQASGILPKDKEVSEGAEKGKN